MENPIIIVGSGIAGLNFALSAAGHSNVLIITKKKILETATNYAQGGISAVIDKADHFEEHVADTLAAGAFHNDKKAVEYMVKHGPYSIWKLIELGVNFQTLKGEIVLRREGGHHTRRIAFCGDYTGQEIERALAKNVRKHPKITVWENTFVLNLLVKDKICYGVQILDGDKVQNVFGKATILATGGLGQVFEHTTNPTFATGDGYAMASRADAKFLDMEFIQFHPTALQTKYSSHLFLLSEALRGEGAHIVNKDGNRFLEKYHKMAELAPRDTVSRACFEEQKKGSIYLDLRHMDQKMLEVRFPQIYKKLKNYKLNPAKDLIPITPAAHYCCGGIKVNLKGQTNIENLYAFGEVAGTGVHGANRLASNSLLEAIVFSSRIAEELKSKRLDNSSPAFELPRFEKPNLRKKRELTHLKKTVQSLMWNNCGIIRKSSDMEKTLDLLGDIDKKIQISGINKETQELKNMIETSTVILKAALSRKESLGAHHMFS